jgi:hypothetical protein
MITKTLRIIIGTSILWVTAGEAQAAVNIIRVSAPILFVTPAVNLELAEPELISPEQVPVVYPVLFYKTSVLPAGVKGIAYSLQANTLIGWNNLSGLRLHL